MKLSFLLLLDILNKLHTAHFPSIFVVDSDLFSEHVPRLSTSTDPDVNEMVQNYFDNASRRSVAEGEVSVHVDDTDLPSLR